MDPTLLMLYDALGDGGAWACFGAGLFVFLFVAGMLALIVGLFAFLAVQYAWRFLTGSSWGSVIVSAQRRALR